MEAWASEFLEVFKTRKIDVAQACLRGLQRNPEVPVKNYTLDDILQMTEGFIAMITESLNGHSSDIRDTYMDSVIPGIFAQGQPMAALVGQMTMNAVLVFNEIIPSVSATHRDEAAIWLTNWYVKFNADIVRIGLANGVKT
jgi:hypothetical protein